MQEKITSLQHPYVKHLVRLRQKRAYRYEQQKIILEGSTLLRELPEDFVLGTVLYTEELLLPSNLFYERAILTTPEVMQKIAGAQSPEGVIAECTMPQQASFAQKAKLLVCDNVSDPGNLGTLLRSAWALGWDGALLVEGCVDPFNDKALRAARGAPLHFPWAWIEKDVLCQRVEQHQGPCFIADLRGEVPCEEHKDSCLLVVGHETQGPSSLPSSLGQRITLPMRKEVDSLNVAVAGSILLYLLR